MPGVATSDFIWLSDGKPVVPYASVPSRT